MCMILLWSNVLADTKLNMRVPFCINSNFCFWFCLTNWFSWLVHAMKILCGLLVEESAAALPVIPLAVSQHSTQVMKFDEDRMKKNIVQKYPK